jgi:hypothetical protein
MVLAHVGGVPVEEFLPSAAGAGAGLLVARAWLALHLRRRSLAARLQLGEDRQAADNEHHRGQVEQ